MAGVSNKAYTANKLKNIVVHLLSRDFASFCLKDKVTGPSLMPFS